MCVEANRKVITRSSAMISTDQMDVLEAVIPSELSQPGQVNVSIAGARNLRPADSNGLSDPYIVVSIKNTGLASDKNDPPYKSEVKKKTLNPVWDQTCHFKVVSAKDAELSVSMWVCLCVCVSVCGYLWVHHKKGAIQECVCVCADNCVWQRCPRVTSTPASPQEGLH